jgi:hypothetical protein
MTNLIWVLLSNAIGLPGNTMKREDLSFYLHQVSSCAYKVEKLSLTEYRRK